MKTEDLSHFVRKTLLPNEICIREARFHWFYILEAVALLTACVLAGFLLSYSYFFLFNLISPWPAVVGTIIGFWVFLCMLLKWWTTEVILTNKRLIHKRGLFLIATDEVDIEQLISDSVEQSMFGRLFDFGTIHITCLIAKDFWLPPIRQPYEFRNAVEKQKIEYRERYTRTTTPVVPGQHHTG